MFSLYTLVPALIYLLIALALTISATRLMWIAGSYIKRRMRKLP